jgi:ABC-type transport system substrate-binding protein
MLWEIPEESSRIAGFQTGHLDTMLMAFDSIPLVESAPGARLMEVPMAGTSALRIYGQWYLGIGTPDQRPGYDPDLPWVSADPQVGSPEWERARNVRQALSIAIDRQTLIDTLLMGFARPSVLGDWAWREDLLPSDMKWEYDPNRARELLDEAGYGDGFHITMTTAIRGAPAEVEACEAIATMWNDIGVDVRFENVPYGTFRPQVTARRYAGASCHALSHRISPSQGFIALTAAAGFNTVEHPWFEERVPNALSAVDPVERVRLELEIGRFLFENAITEIGLYTFSGVWPVGSSIEDWSEHVMRGDLRNMNGYEYIRPR